MDRYESILSKCTLQACWPSGSWSLASYRGSIWFHLLKLAGMTNAASSWRTRLAAWLCGKYFGPRVLKKNTNIQGFGVEASGKLFCLSPGSSAQRIAPAVGGVLLEIGGFSCQSSRLNKSKTVARSKFPWLWTAWSLWKISFSLPTSSPARTAVCANKIPSHRAF